MLNAGAEWAITPEAVWVFRSTLGLLISLPSGKSLGQKAVEQLGPVLVCSKAVPVTETEAEFAVQLIKHVFEQFVVLEFYITNTLSGVALADAKVTVNPAPDKFAVVGTVPVDNIAYNTSKSA